jgi:hypothetical protein
MPALPVTIRFFGICTHFGFESMEDAVDWYHRVVLVNASDPAHYRRDNPQLAGVDPHKAHLQIRRADVIGEPPAASWLPITYDDGAIVEWALDGVYLRIDAPVPARNPRNLAPCIPGLGQHLLSQPLPPPGPRARVPNRADTACFFDFGPVEVRPWILDGGAVIAAIDVWSSKLPVITATSFEGETLAIPIVSGTEIAVSNIPDDPKADKEIDFLLHYLTLAEFPLNAWFPAEPFTCAPPLESTGNLPRNLPLLTTPGCSDSNYP